MVSKITNRLRTLIHGLRGRFDFLYRVHPSPLLLMGNQKSGTTAIASLLALATGKSYTNDPLYASRLKSEESFHDYVKRNPRLFSSAVIKDPNFAFFFEDLRNMYPDSKLIFICRDPRQNLRSLLDRMGLPGNKCRLDESDRKHLRHIGWEWILEGSECESYNYIDMLADRWNANCDVYLKNQDEFILVRYEDFAADKLTTILSLASQLQLRQVNEIGDKLNYSFQPKGRRSSLSFLEIFGVRNLTRLTTRCHQNMEALGYSIDN